MMDRAGLEAYLRLSEGEMPPVFKGREDILAALRDCGEWTRQFIQESDHTKPQVRLRGIPKITQIVQGAPGAGKSSILAKLQEECDASKDNPSPRVLIVSSQDVIQDTSKVISLVGVAGGLSTKKWRALPHRISLGLSVSQIVNVTGELDWARRDLTSMKTLRDLMDVFPLAQWTAPVIVAVDEAQRLRGEVDTPPAQFLQSIHDASSGLPLVLVLAGLSDTRDRAVDIGLTRGLTIHNVSCLSQPECEELMVEFCQKFGVDPSGCEPRLHDLATPTEGWPRHLHFMFKAFAKELLCTNGDLAKVRWDQVQTVSAQGRLSYYQHQQNSTFLALKPLIGAVMEDVREGDGFKTITNSIRHHVVPDMLDDLPDGMRDIRGFPRQLVEEMIHQGALQEYEPDRFFSPIPSFRAHLIKEGIMDPSRSLPPCAPFRLYYGTILNEEKDGFESYGEARAWALEKLTHMSDAEDISLWYGDIVLETLRLAMPALSKPGDGEDPSFGL
ncbi:MAG: hypothetical protein OXC63_09340 [Aestuariivita sp.]|nr:hypothetical protein [Aestuariivita sp.]MCY4345168.1 hypothetical protein [Aestuariivita sp.]